MGNDVGDVLALDMILQGEQPQKILNRFIELTTRKPKKTLISFNAVHADYARVY
jgi:hypothetical protein